MTISLFSGANMFGFNSQGAGQSLRANTSNPWEMISQAQKMSAKAENKALNGIANEDSSYNPYENRQNLFAARMLMRYGYSAEDEKIKKQRLDLEYEDKGRKLISPA